MCTKTPFLEIAAVGVRRLDALANHSSLKERIEAPRVAEVRFVVLAKCESIDVNEIGVVDEGDVEGGTMVSWMVSGERAWTSMVSGYRGRDLEI